MSEQTQRPDDEDVQGHMPRIRFGVDREDASGSDDVEGHGYRKPEDTSTGSEDDAEGHIIRVHGFHDADGQEVPQPTGDDVEGHGYRMRNHPTDDEADDVEGHVIRVHGFQGTDDEAGQQYSGAIDPDKV